MTNYESVPFLMDKFGNKTEIREFPFKIGRGKENNLSIDDVYVSYYHAAIYKENMRYYIVDYGSLNGTFLNDMDNNVKKELLDDNSILYFSEVKYTFHTGD